MGLNKRKSHSSFYWNRLQNFEPESRSISISKYLCVISGFKWDLRSSEKLRSVWRQFLTDVSGKPIATISLVLKSRYGITAIRCPIYQNSTDLKQIPVAIFFFFFYWHYNPLWVLVFSVILFHSALSLHCFLHCLIPIICISSSISTRHLFLGLPLILVPIGFHSNILLGVLLSYIRITWPSLVILLLFIKIPVKMLICIYRQRQQFNLFNNATCCGLYDHLQA